MHTQAAPAGSAWPQEPPSYCALTDVSRCLSLQNFMLHMGPPKQPTLVEKQGFMVLQPDG